MVGAILLTVVLSYIALCAYDYVSIRLTRNRQAATEIFDNKSTTSPKSDFQFDQTYFTLKSEDFFIRSSSPAHLFETYLDLRTADAVNDRTSQGTDARTGNLPALPSSSEERIVKVGDVEKIVSLDQFRKRA